MITFIYTKINNAYINIFMFQKTRLKHVLFVDIRKLLTLGGGVVVEMLHMYMIPGAIQ